MEKNNLKNSKRFSEITHEIKNSLNPVINLSSLLIRNTSGKLTDEENSYLEVIERNGRKILHQLDELNMLFMNDSMNEDMDERKISESDASDEMLEDELSSRGIDPHIYTREFVMLIIDDDVDNIIPVNAIIENEFKGMGKVYHAESGGMGLDMLEKIKPDIILLDLTLPDISGLSLVKNIKHLFVKKDVPVIAFTGMDIAVDREKMLKYGFDDVIKKPFNIDTFTQKIRKWID